MDVTSGPVPIQVGGPIPAIEDVLIRPPDDTVLWRYLDLASFLLMLKSNAIWFSRVDLLGDPFEGSLSQVAAMARDIFIAEVADGHDGTARQLADALSARDWRRAVFVSCWHASEHESYAMWRLYTADSGVAIRTTVGRLSEELVRPARSDPSEGVIHLGEVQYIDYASESMPSGSTLFASMFKRREFKHEAEVRAMFMNLDWAIHELPVDLTQEAPKGFDVGVNIANLIDEVRVAPTAPRRFVDLIKDLSGRYGLHARVAQSDLQAGPGW